MYGQTPAAIKLLSRAYSAVLRRMWLNNAIFTVALTAGGIAGGASVAQACEYCGNPDATHDITPISGSGETEPPVTDAYYNGNPDTDGTYKSLYTVNPAGVFATPTPYPAWRNLGTQRMVLFYYHGVDEADMDTVMYNGVTMHTQLIRNADTARAYYAAMSGGQLDLQFDIIDVPLTRKADGTPWTSSTAQAAMLTTLGVNLSSYAFAGNYYTSDSTLITTPTSTGSSPVPVEYTTSTVQSQYNYKVASTLLHELGHSLGLNHARSMILDATTPSYSYDYVTKTYVATSGTGSGVVANLPIGSVTREYGSTYSIMGTDYVATNDLGLSPRQKISAGWLKPRNLANLNALNPAGGTNTVKIYDDMVDHNVVTNGASGSALQYGVDKAYSDNVYYGAYLVRPGDTFHITGSGATATGKWQAYTQTLDFFYRSHAAAYPGYEAAPTVTPGIVVTLGGVYLGIIKVGQTLLEKDFSQSLFLPVSTGFNDGNHSGVNQDDGSPIALGTSTDITTYGTSAPLNPNRYRSIWYQLTYVNDGVDGNGHWANLQVQSFTGAQVYGWQWDATSGTAGAQDGSGTWTAGSGNWRSVSMALDNQNWTQAEDAVFGSGTGVAGTVNLGGNITANSIAFKATGGGNYTINGNGNTLTIDVGGVNAEVSATLATPVALASQQLWSVSSGATLNVTGIISPGSAHALYKMGQGTLALGGVNNWTSELRVTEGLVQQNANQTFNANLIIGEAGVYRVAGGTLALASGKNIDGIMTGPSDSERVISYGLLDLAAGGTSANPELSFAGTSTVAVNTQVGNGSHYLGAAGTVTVSGTISGTGTLIKQGSGTLRLTGANTFSGNITVNGGKLAIDSYLSKDGAFSVTVNTGGSLSLGDAFNGYTATVGSLSGTGGTIDTSYDTAAGTRTLGVNQTAAGTFAGVLADASGGRVLALTKSGAATLTLSGTNTYSGTTTISAGTLQIGAGGATGTLGSGAVVNNATLAFNRTDTALTVTNAISGTGSLTQAGSGTTTLSGANTYTGATQINAGTLKAGAANVFGVNSAVTLANTAGATLALNNFNQAIGSLSGGGATGGNVTLGTATLTTGGDNTSTAYAGIISGTGGLKKTGAGNLTLSGKNTYTGATTVTGGVITADFSAAGAPTSNILASTSTLVMNGGTMLFKGKSGATNSQTFSGTTITAGLSTLALLQNGATSLDVNLGAITQNSGGTINFTGITGAAAGARFITSTGSANGLLDGGAQWAMVNGSDWAAKDATNTYVVTFSGYTDVPTNNGVIGNDVTKSIRITEGGAGVNTLSATTTSAGSLLMSAGTTAAVISTAGKTLVLGQGNAGAVAVAQGAKSLTLGAAANDGVITVDSTNTAKNLTLISNNASAAQGLFVNAQIQNNAAGGVVSLVASGGSGAGTVILAGDNGYTGTTTVTNAGTLQIGNGGATGKLGAGAVTVNDGSTLAFNRSDTALVVANTISGAGRLSESGAGTTTLTGANTYAGGTTVSNGFLVAGNSQAFGTGTVTVGSSGNAPRVQLSNGVNLANALVLNTSTGTAGRGMIEVTGTANATWSGAITINATPTAGGHFYTDSGATLVITGPITSSVTIVQRGGNVILSGGGDYTAYNLTGNLKLGADNGLTTQTALTLGVAGNGVFDLNGRNQRLTGLTKSVNGASVTNTGANAALLSLDIGADATYAGTIDAGSGGELNLFKSDAGTLTLSGANTHTGITTVSLGTLKLANSLALQNSVLQVGAASAVIFDQSVASHAFTIGNLSGTRNLALADNAATPNAIALSVGNNTSHASYYSGVLSGAGSLTKVGAGTTNLSGNNTYTGSTTVSSGTLVLGNANALGAGGAASATFVLSGGTLDLNGVAVNSAELLSIVGSGVAGAGALVNTGAGQYNAMNNLTLTGDATIGGTGLFGIKGGTGPKLDLAGYTLTKTGSNQLSVNAVTITNGNIVINSGSISLEFGTTLTGTGTVTVNNGGALKFWSTTGSKITRDIVVNTGGMIQNIGSSASANSRVNLAGTTATIDNGDVTQTFVGVISGAAALTLQGSGTTVFSGPNTFSGTTTITEGTLLLKHTQALQNSTLTTGGTTFDSSVVSRAFTFGGLSGSGNLSLLNNAGSPATIALTIGNNNQNTVHTGVISGGGSIVKTGGGKLTLAGANTYTGGTTINVGTLIAAGTTALGSGAGAVHAITGATLQIGDGVNNAVTLGSGAMLVMDSGSILKLGGLDSKISMTGTGKFTLTSGMKLDITGLGIGSGLSLGQSTQYTLITGGTSGNAVGTWSAGSNLIGGSLANYSYSLAMSGNNALFSVTAIPEPTTYGLLGAGTLAAVAFVRRRRRVAKAA